LREPSFKLLSDQGPRPGNIERKKGGSIIIIGGMGILTALNSNTAAMIASKAGAYGLVKSLAKALGPHGIRANIIAPGTMETKISSAELSQGGTHPQDDANRAKNCHGRFGKPQEVANVALFLLQMSPPTSQAIASTAAADCSSRGNSD